MSLQNLLRYLKGVEQHTIRDLLQFSARTQGFRWGEGEVVVRVVQ